jgi:DNA repair photolyase
VAEAVTNQEKIVLYEQTDRLKSKNNSNAFRLDSWKGCSHQCTYCYSNQRKGLHYPGFGPGNIEKLKKYLHLAFETDRKKPGITIECLRHRVPLHLGVMSDPLQPAALETTKLFLKELAKYKYPVQISSKAVPKFDFDPEIVAFQVSLMSMQEYLMSRVEPGAPTPKERIAYMRWLKKQNAWVCLRMHAIFDVEDASEVLNEANDIVDFVSTSWLDVPAAKRIRKDVKLMCELMGKDLRVLHRNGIFYYLPFEERLEGTLRLLEESKVPVGSGDFHELSDTDNCCGLDTIGPAFDNWIRYNRMALDRTQNYDAWTPRGGLRSVIISNARKPGLHTLKDYVDNYMLEVK